MGDQDGNDRMLLCRTLAHSFPRPAWDCDPGRSAATPERRGASPTAFPRGAWERGSRRLPERSQFPLRPVAFEIVRAPGSFFGDPGSMPPVPPSEAMTSLGVTQLSAGCGVAPTSVGAETLTEQEMTPRLKSGPPATSVLP